jgi:hypothetical protein
MIDLPPRQIRAVYDDKTVRVYQAYSDDIAESALALGRFVSPPFKMTRITWIKPSFLWMMYRSGWGLKDPGQNRILAIDITRDGFEWALAHSCLSQRGPGMNDAQWDKIKKTSSVRIQWDPERDLFLNPLSHRAIQIGLGSEAVERYVSQWIVNVTDVTSLTRHVHDLVLDDKPADAEKCLPVETPYPLSEALRERLCAAL